MRTMALSLSMLESIACRWAYGGEGRPRIPNANWTAGDDFIGDPPHEPQGWYSVYDTDVSTLELIKRYATMRSAVSKLALSVSVVLLNVISLFLCAA